MKTKNKDYNLYRPFSQFGWTTGWVWQASSHLLNLALKETPAAEIKLSFVTGEKRPDVLADSWAASVSSAF